MNPPAVTAPSAVSVPVVPSVPPVVLPTTTISIVPTVAAPSTSAPVQGQAPIPTSEVTITFAKNIPSQEPAPPSTVAPKIPSPPDQTPSIPTGLNQTPSNQNTLKQTPSNSTPTFNTPPTHPTPRPRGRPPGSKNSTPSASSTLHANQLNSHPFNQLDPTAMAAVMSMYKNPALVQALMSQSNDPSEFAALFTEYIKMANLQGMSALLGNNSNPIANPSPFAHSNPSTSGSPSKLPIFDINSLITSATEKMIPTSPSAVVNIGSGQLTITPSAAGQGSSHPSVSGYKMNQTPQHSDLSSQMFSDMPKISMTKVKPKSQKSNMLIPSDLPKSLTITPTPPIGSHAQSSYTSKYPSLSNMQYPNLQMMPDTRPYARPRGAPKQQGRNKKLPKNQGTFAMHNQLPSGLSGPNPFASIPSSPFDPSSTEYNQQLTALSTYIEMMKNKAEASALLPHMDQFGAYPKKAPAKTKSKQLQQQQQQQQQLLQQQQQLSAALAASQSSPKGRLSVKQLQSMQQQSHSTHLSNSFGQLAASTSGIQVPPNQMANPYSLLAASSFGPMSNTGGMVGAGPSSSSSTNSPLRSPVHLPPSPVLSQSPSGHSQIR